MEIKNGQISISELLDLGYTFEIPNYQRGYRWEKTEVIDLLEDINSIGNNKNYNDLKEYCENHMYCLQPLSLDDGDNEKHKIVVDGQQRLTTIFLILKFITNKLETYSEEILHELEVEELKDYNRLLSIKYEDEKRDAIFNKISNSLNEINEEDVDAYYITNAYQYIRSWATDNINKAVSLLDFAIKLYYGTSVILYPIKPEYDGQPYEYFAKTNTGRIPLTNSELIKASLMLKENCIPDIYKEYQNDGNELSYAEKDKIEKLQEESLQNERLKISRQWDSVEIDLRRDEFWYFLTTDSDIYENTRIDYIFDIVARKLYKEVQEELGGGDVDNFFEINKERASFIVISRYLIKNRSNQDVAIGTIVWKNVWDTFMRLKDWFNDYEWYHLVGYLTNAESDDKAEDLLKYFNNSTENFNNKNDIKKKLKEKIKALVGIYYSENEKRNKSEYREYLKSLKYDKSGDSAVITNILLLFNVISILGDFIAKKKDKVNDEQKTRDAFFPFSRYKKEKWNKEHIHSVNQESFSKVTADNYIKYIKEMKNFLENSDDTRESELLDKMISEYETKKEEFINNGETSNQASIMAVDKIATLWREEMESNLDYDELMGIGNLALLDEKTNKSYKNAPFFMKRLIIHDIAMGKRDNTTRFIPICTRNVFDKTYTKSPYSMMQWNQDDYYDYLDNIVDTLYNYLEESN